MHVTKTIFKRNNYKIHIIYMYCRLQTVWFTMTTYQTVLLIFWCIINRIFHTFIFVYTFDGSVYEVQQMVILKYNFYDTQ